jgi:hypothetical protein
LEYHRSILVTTTTHIIIESRRCLEQGELAAMAAAVPRGVVKEEAIALEDVEYILDDVLGTLARLEKKRAALQDQIACASRGRRPHHRRANAEGDEPAYTRKGAGAVRKRLRAAAGDVKKERERLEAVWGRLQEAAVDAKERLALPPAA